MPLSAMSKGSQCVTMANTLPTARGTHVDADAAHVEADVVGPVAVASPHAMEGALPQLHTPA